MLAVAVAYYVGATVGFLFQRGPVPQSVLWTPNSILLAALLVTPRSSWRALLLAAFPAHMLVAWQTHAPLVTMALLFVTNAADATIGALLLRSLSGDEWRPSGLLPMAAFIILGAPIGPLLVSFADAGISVAMHWGSDFWLAYQTRVRANVLTNVIFVPAAVAFVNIVRERAASISMAKCLEATLMLVGLTLSAGFVFSDLRDSASIAVRLYAPLSFLLWAAVRFGPGMASGALLVLAYIATWTAMNGLGAFSAGEPSHIVPTLQLFLLATALPILCLAAVVQERKRGADALLQSQRALTQSVEESRALAGRLLTAEESVRSHIARELHDDVNQRLAALSIALSAIKQRLPRHQYLVEQVARLQQETAALADDIRDLSHQLHPSMLRHAGLIPAVRSLCSQFDPTHTIRTDLSASGEDVRVSFDVALCVYRVAQEALKNVAKHAQASVVRVALTTADTEVELSVSDDGRGFNAHEARRSGGLGLTSIDERVRLAHGLLRLDTSPGRGTTVHISVPNGERNASPNSAPRG